MGIALTKKKQQKWWHCLIAFFLSLFKYIVKEEIQETKRDKDFVRFCLMSPLVLEKYTGENHFKEYAISFSGPNSDSLIFFLCSSFTTNLFPRLRD